MCLLRCAAVSVGMIRTRISELECIDGKYHYSLILHGGTADRLSDLLCALEFSVVALTVVKSV